MPDLEAVIVVDEADESLEDERAPTWNARDVAVERAGRTGAGLHMVTPAPSVDAMVALGDPTFPEHPRWPRVTVVDTRDEVPGQALLTSVLADDLRRVTGIGAARAAQVLAAVELGRRTLVRAPRSRPQFTTPREVAAYLMPQFGSCAVEQFGVVLLDVKHRVLKTRLLSVGSLDASVVHPREVFRTAVVGGAAAVVLFHNHPSGDATPSREDLELTRRLVAAGELMGITVLDHVILADTRYVSLRESGALEVG
jgi:DNA repair protein RadC